MFLRRLLIYTHRWLGIGGGLLFVAWFVSGIVLMYVGMPALDAHERGAMLPALNLDTARLSPMDAALAAGMGPSRIRVGMLHDRPVYRLFASGRWTTVFADDGTVLGWLSEAEVLAEARRLAGDHAISLHYAGKLDDADQWSFGVRAMTPLHRVALGDAAGTTLYLSDQTGEPVLDTTGVERRWAYAGAVLHWLYFTPLRRHGEIWTQTVIWLSVAGIVMCLSGLIWGVWRYSPSARYRLKHVHAHSPYAGWMQWHHYAGLIFGLTTFTWIFSGLLSMEPWNWHPGTAPTAAQRDALSGGPLQFRALTLTQLRDATSALEAASAEVPRELDLIQFKGEPFWTANGYLVSAAAPHRGAFVAFDREEVQQAVASAMPGVPVRDITWLQEYDAYYYDRRGGRPLPVLRVRYLDPQQSWLYADPSRGQIVLKEERLTRVNRWLYHGLHSLDFPFLYDKRPLWDIVVIVLSIGGIVSSVTTLAPAWHRLRRLARGLRA